MAVIVLSAISGDPVALRQLLARAKAPIGLLTSDEAIADRLSRVVWELLTNVHHAGAPSSSTVVIVVDVEARRIVVRLPGPPFDSVARAQCPGARGLDTVRWRLSASGWRWAHCYAAGSNEVSLEEERP